MKGWRPFTIMIFAVHHHNNKHFLGRYEFKKDSQPIDVDKMLEMLDKIDLGDAIKKKGSSDRIRVC